MHDAARWVWGKTGGLELGREDLWLPVWRHLEDTAGIAEILWQQWLPSGLRSRISRACGSDDQAQRLVGFLAGIHDVGKATPMFNAQIADRPNKRINNNLIAAGVTPALAEVRQDKVQRQIRHEIAGHAIVQRWSKDIGLDWHVTDVDRVAGVVGGHHGVAPSRNLVRLAGTADRATAMGDDTWIAVQDELMAPMLKRYAAEDLLDKIDPSALTQPVQVMLTGIVIMADWIASCAEYFPLCPIGQQPQDDPDRIAIGWDQAGLNAPWRPPAITADAADLLTRRFSLPAGATARPVQIAAVENAQQLTLPGIMIIEAPMGEGKTEAALLAAEILAQRSGAGGLFVALPTQATTDAMFARVNAWINHLEDIAPEDAPEGAGGKSVTLAHSKAAYNLQFQRLRWALEDAATNADHMRGFDANGVGVDGESEHRRSVRGYVSQWTSGRKKRVLADFMIGTVDQLLFTTLQAKHLVLRHLGVARQVVIVDEVHAYDVYMSVYLHRALTWLGAHGVPVILLSATLPAASREKLLAAYGKGRAHFEGSPGAGSTAGTGRKPWHRQPATQVHTQAQVQPPALQQANVASQAYPVITASAAHGHNSTVLQPSGRSTQVAMHTLADDDQSLLALLNSQLVDGGCAVVVRNTVNRAQRTAAFLREHFADVTLSHSRFMTHDRMANDQGLLRRFGPGCDHRPKQAIVVATQVVEQSLDVDFDLMVTDIAPVDLLLQRLGRVHRHRRGIAESERPEKLRQAQCWVTGVTDWSGEPPLLDGGCERVYSRDHLIRSAHLVLAQSTLGPLRLPEDIVSWVEFGYSAGAGLPSSWQDAHDVALADTVSKQAQRESAASGYVLAAPATGSLVEWTPAQLGAIDEKPEGRAQVRDAEDSIEAVMVDVALDGTWRIPAGHPRLGGAELSRDLPPHIDLAKALASCTVRFPSYIQADRLIRDLEATCVESWQESWPLEGQLVFLSYHDRPTELAGKHFRYDSQEGLREEKI